MIAKQTMSLHIAPVPVWKMVQLFFLYIDPVKFLFNFNHGSIRCLDI